MYNNEENGTMSLKDLLEIFINYKRIFAISIVVCVELSMIYNIFLVAPTYTSSGTIYVNCMSDSNVQAGDGISQYEIDSSRALSTTYMEILRGRSFLEDVSADIGYKYTWKDIASMMSVASVNETELLSIKVTAYEPEDAYVICKSIMYNAPRKMLSVFKRGAIEVVDDVNMPLLPSKPGVKKAFLLGFVLGFIVAAAITFMIEIFDTKIRTSEDLVRRYDINVLGEIFH